MKLSKGVAVHKFSHYFLWVWLQQRQKGFTLIELLVVLIIVSVLSAIALPNFIHQVGKARETDATIKLGSIARSQQAYHFEKKTFAPTISSLTLSGGVLSSNYYTFPDPSSVDASKVTHQAIAINPNSDQVRDYAVGVYFSAGAYTRSTCQGADVGDVVDAPDTAAGVCTNGGKKLE